MITTAAILFLALIHEYKLPPTDAATLTCIAQHESAFYIDVINHHLNSNGTKDYGLFQINSIWLEGCNTTVDKLLTMSGNIQCAIQVKQQQGFDAWVAYSKCGG